MCKNSQFACTHIASCIKIFLSIFMLFGKLKSATYIPSLGFIYIYLIPIYCILRGWIKRCNSSITAIMCQVGSYRTVVG